MSGQVEGSGFLQRHVTESPSAPTVSPSHQLRFSVTPDSLPLSPIAALESVGPEHCVVGCATVMRLSKYVIMCASPPLFPNAHIHIHTNSHIPLQQTWVQCCAADPTGCEERAQRNGSREVPHAGICTHPLISAPNAPSISLGNYLADMHQPGLGISHRLAADGKI